MQFCVTNRRAPVWVTCQTANYKDTPIGHEFNDVLETEFYFPSTELQPWGHTTCLTKHQNRVTAVAICANDVVTRDSQPQHHIELCMYEYMYSLKRDSETMVKINKQLIYQINHDGLIDCKCRGKSISSP